MQEQLWHLTRAGGQQNKHDLVKEDEEKSKNLCKVFQKIIMNNFGSTTHLHFIPSNLTIIKAFSGTFLAELKPCKFQQTKKTLGSKSEKKGKERKRKIKVETALSRRFGSLETDSDQQPTPKRSFQKK